MRRETAVVRIAPQRRAMPSSFASRAVSIRYAANPSTKGCVRVRQSSPGRTGGEKRTEKRPCFASLSRTCSASRKARGHSATSSFTTPFSLITARCASNASFVNRATSKADPMADRTAASSRSTSSTLALERLLGEHGARTFLPFGAGFPLLEQRLFLGLEVLFEAEQQLVLISRLLPKQQSFEDRFDDLLGIHRHGHGYAERAADLLVLANQDVEHDSVNLVVGAVVGNRPHFGTGLSVAVHPSFPLLVARRVPGEVVVEHRVEVALQVDAFAEAIRSHQHVLRRFCQSGDPQLPLGRSKFPGDGGDFDLFLQSSSGGRRPRNPPWR